MPTVNKILDARVKVIQDRALERNGEEMSRADALDRIYSAGLGDVPRLADELADHQARADAFDALVAAGDVAPNAVFSKAASHAELVAQVQDAIVLETAILVAVAAELGYPTEAGSPIGAVINAHDATVAVKES
jgi:hypothetical protein